MQATTRAAAQAGGNFIRKMRPFEKHHTFALNKWDAVECAFWVGFFTLEKGHIYA
jgi:hypothetical protein